MSKGKPDPQCQDCKGTGQITLFTSISICDCVNRKSVITDLKEDYPHPSKYIKSEDFKIKTIYPSDIPF